MEDQIHEYDGAADPRTRHRMISEAYISDIRPLDEVVAAARALPSKWKEKPDPLGELADIRHGDDDRIANLEAEVATLRAEVQMLRANQQRQTGAAIRERFGTDFICK